MDGHYIYPHMQEQSAEFPSQYSLAGDGFPYNPYVDQLQPEQQDRHQQSPQDNSMSAQLKPPSKSQSALAPRRTQKQTQQSLPVADPPESRSSSTGVFRNYQPELNQENSNQAFQRLYKYSIEGVLEARAQWEIDWANRPLPPPPPQTYYSKDEAIEACKSFSVAHGYRLVTGHSYRDKQLGCINRIMLRCEQHGQYKNHHGLTEANRVRQRISRKTGCPMLTRIQKKKNVEEWVVCITVPQHNHSAERCIPGAQLEPTKFPDLEAALYDWHTQALSKGEAPHGNVVKSKALALFAEMPQYQGQPTPDLDRMWLDNYRKRYKLPGKAAPRPSGPPQLVDWSDPAAAAAALVLAPAKPVTKEDITFTGLDAVFPEGNLLNPVRSFVKQYMSRFDASHDWNHIIRVFTLARQILRQESVPFGTGNYNHQVVFLVALLHDVGDHKYAIEGENPENQIADLLLEHGASLELVTKIQLIAKNVSFSNEIKNPRMMKAVLDAHPELAIVQDADRLDAIGAIGIGRTFTYGGAKQPGRGMEGTVEHFTEKLERLEGMMKTATGKRLAKERTERLRVFRSWWEEENAVFDL